MAIQTENIEKMIGQLRTRYALCPNNRSGFCTKPGITRRTLPDQAKIVSSAIIDKDTGEEKLTARCAATGAFNSLDQVKTGVGECLGSIEFSR